jgi:diadenosine tetraphosphate (Ap4A) HIT family hydrolase
MTVKQIEAALGEIHAYEATEDGDLILYVNHKPDNDGVRVVIPSHDLGRMMYAAIDALRFKRSTR